MNKNREDTSLFTGTQDSVSALKDTTFNENCIYYYIIMDQFHVYCNEAIEEILRERNSRINSSNFKGELWLVNSPLFVNEENLLSKIKKTRFFETNIKNIAYPTLDLLNNQIANSYYLTALVSTNENVINNAKLRIGSFEDISKIEINDWEEELENFKTGIDAKSNGIWGSLSYPVGNNILLKSSKRGIHPLILNRVKENALF